MQKKLLLLFIGLAIFVAGCSDDKKEEAARLEQELLGEDTAADTMVSELATPDSLQPQRRAETGDAGAIPDEDIPALPEQPAGSGFAVQVAGCEDSGYASYLVDLYRTRGYDPWVTTATVNGQLYYRVRLGFFETQAEANLMKQELNDKYSINPWVDYIG